MGLLSKKGQDSISIFFLLAILISTIIVIFVTIPGFFDFVIKSLSDVLFSIIFIAVGSFLILFGIIFAGKSLRTGKSLAYFGVGILIIGLFIIEIAYVVKAKEALTTPMAVRCSGSGNNIFQSGNAAEFVMCVVTGYKYKGSYGGWAFMGYWIFGVIVPILLLMSLFYDFVDSSGVIRQPRSKKIVGYSLGLIAYRGFVVTNLLEILSIGTTGIAVLAIDLIFLGGLLAYIHRVFEKWRPIEHAMGVVRASANARMMLRNYIKEAIRLIKEGNDSAALDILENMEHLANRLDWKNYITQAKNSIAQGTQGGYTEALNKLNELKNSIDSRP